MCIRDRLIQKLAEENPSWATETVIPNACAAHNELERVKGYSPHQRTLGLSRPLWAQAMTRCRTAWRRPTPTTRPAT
eukprot:4955362-Alexandrium_andersonii.AAC.1